MEEIELDPAFDQSKRARLKRFALRIINTRYLMIALLIHVVALAMFGGKVIFDAIAPKGDFKTEEVFVVKPLDSPPLPPVTPPKSEQSTAVKFSAPSVEPVAPRLATPNPSPVFNVPLPEITLEPSDAFQPKPDDAVHQRVREGERVQLQNIRNYLKGSVTGDHGTKGVTGTKTKTVAKFTCYVAQYADGDWDCNFGRVADNRWYSNCIYNLMLQIGRWTQGRVKGELKPEALKLADREWIDRVKPPFIFITGHKDFKFTQSEVDNLREYLMLGGALWVDNSLPGRRSRFDEALRREMQRVLPNQPFQTINNTHPVYGEYFKMGGPPKGMNSYQEPVEVIKVAGQASVFYTLNAYSDLWETGLTSKDEIDTDADWSPSLQTHIHRMGPHYISQGRWDPFHPVSEYQFYRNVNQKSIVAAYQFGIDIVIHLLTRFQDQFENLPNNA